MTAFVLLCENGLTFCKNSGKISKKGFRRRNIIMKRKTTNCEDCVHYDYNDESGTYECGEELDEDELIRFLKGDGANCSHFKFYDEYKFVRKQN